MKQIIAKKAKSGSGYILGNHFVYGKASAEAWIAFTYKGEEVSIRFPDGDIRIFDFRYRDKTGNLCKHSKMIYNGCGDDVCLDCGLVC